VRAVYLAYSLSLQNLEEMVAERSFGRPFDRAPLGYQACTVIRKSVSLAQAIGRQELEDG
jgi:hypothetical protein